MHEDQMGLEKISTLLLRFSLPAITGMVVNALYNVVDSIFVGRGVGDMALAGVTVSLPIIIILMAFVMLIAMGATSLISIRLGEQKKSESEKIVGNALGLIIVLGLALTFLGLIFLEPLLSLFGASQRVLPYAVDYMRIILMGSIFMAVGVGMNNFIRAEGNPKIAMYTMLIGAFTNIILDYIYIFIFHWGVQGAALATISSYVVTSTWVLYYFLSGKSKLKLRLKNMRPKKLMIKRIIIIGFPAFAMQITTSVQQLILNRSLVYYGGDLALAAIGIIMSIANLLIMPILGISQGAQPIIGYNYGAKKFKRVKKTLLASIGAATGILILGFMVIKLWPSQLVGIFNENPQLIDLSVHAMLIFFTFLPLIGVQIIGGSYFQAIGKPTQSTIISLSRQVLIFIPLLLILPSFWGLEGVWRAAPIADIGAFVLAGIWLWGEIKTLKQIEEVEESKLNECQEYN